MKSFLTISALTLLAACTKPPAESVGIEEQPRTWHYERNPAQLPTTSEPAPAAMVEDPETMPVQDPIGQGTVRTPRYVDDVPRQ